jgi:hypothetical protein
VNGDLPTLVMSYVGCALGSVLVALRWRRPSADRCRHEPPYEDEELVHTPAVRDRFDLSIRWQVSVSRCVHCGEAIASVRCLTGRADDPLLLGAWVSVDGSRQLLS